MTSYTHTDSQTGAVITFTVDWGMPASRSYPREDPTVHGMEITLDGELITSELEAAIIARNPDRDLIDTANEAERDRADDKGDHALELQREAAL